VIAMTIPIGMKRILQIPSARSRPYHGRWTG
jgi:hypothetical protein